MGIFLFSFSLVTACAVNHPTADEVIPAIKYAAMQNYVATHVIRWLALTNSATPYVVTNTGVIQTTNIRVEILPTNSTFITNIYTNLVSQVHLTLYHDPSTNFSYYYSIDMYYSLFGGIAYNSTNLYFTDMAEANAALSNARMINIESSTIQYKLGTGNVVNSKVSNLLFSSENTNIAVFTNESMFYSSIKLTNSARFYNPDYFVATGTVNTNSFFATYKYDSSDIYIKGTPDQSKQYIFGSGTGYVTVDDFTYFYQLQFYNTNMIARFTTIQAYNGDLDLNVLTGE